MSYMFSTNRVRPNKLTSKKDKKYHSDYAKFCLSTMDNYIYRRYINRCLVNWSFFKGGDGQWIFDEDVESFFLDESGDIRNRLKWTKNVIKPMVQQYVRNAIRIDYTAKASCISDFVINKREEDLSKIKKAEIIAEEFPEFEEQIKDKNPIGDNPLETEEIFQNMFVGDFAEYTKNIEQVDLQTDDLNKARREGTANIALLYPNLAETPIGLQLTDSERAQINDALVNELLPGIKDTSQFTDDEHSGLLRDFAARSKVVKERRDNYGKNELYNYRFFNNIELLFELEKDKFTQSRTKGVWARRFKRLGWIMLGGAIGAVVTIKANFFITLICNAFFQTPISLMLSVGVGATVVFNPILAAILYIIGGIIILISLWLIFKKLVISKKGACKERP